MKLKDLEEFWRNWDENQKEITIEPNKKQEIIQYQSGWICPKCGSVYGPSVRECYRCNSPNCDVTWVKEESIIAVE